jgi:hypothetical protein
MFGRRDSAPADTVEAEPVETLAPTGKGRPTPTRADARQARRNASPANRKDSAALRRDQGRDARSKARAALLGGDERDLPPRDAGPERKLARDVVDSRFTLGQFFMIVIAAVFVFGTLATSAFKNANVQAGVNLASLLAFTLIIADCARCGRLAKKGVTERFGAGQARGISSYAFLRAMQPRRFRRPPPKVGRGGVAV